MAKGISFVNLSDWSVITGQIALGGTPSGIWFDGFGFWATQANGSVSHAVLRGNSFHSDLAQSITTELPSGLTAVGSIVGNGKNFFISYTEDTGIPPIVAFRTSIAIFDHNLKNIGELVSARQGQGLGTGWSDLTWDGKYLYATRDSGAAPKGRIAVFDTHNDVLISSTDQSTIVKAISYDGTNIVALNEVGNMAILDPLNFTILTSGPNLANVSNVQAVCHLNELHTEQNFRFRNYNSGIVAIVHLA